ncbi:hypothetical protein SH1V18_31450 [Vallitalea longa]|uniref:DUF2500 domain-containing protein n=1 Tax=Vallitalea longa TaxID=2936439 RepID=A0A9W5YDQ5_9FIRM|nr:DUF2500 domain-containing protein [Vallitalea longa]GKX30665.1 hypothetical protein SH1V18_31450 [Vallitalea longa]
MGFGGFSFFNTIFPIFFIIVFVIIIITVVKSLKEASYNRSQPKLTVNATVVAKRTHMTRRTGDNNRGFTHYYATFQFDKGDRLEMKVDSYKYGMLVEGDKGNLTFQGNKFYDFERNY